MFTDFPKIMVWHFHVPETQMRGMINFLHHRQNSRLIGFRDIKNHRIVSFSHDTFSHHIPVDGHLLAHQIHNRKRIYQAIYSFSCFSSILIQLEG